MLEIAEALERSWELAKSRTERTCCRVMEGYSFRNWSIVSPPSRKSIRLWTGTRVPRKQAFRSYAAGSPTPLRPFDGIVGFVPLCLRLLRRGGHYQLASRHGPGGE